MALHNTKELQKQFPLLTQLIDLKEVCWFNPNVTSLEEGLPYVGLDAKDIDAASQRLKRFAPYIMQSFLKPLAITALLNRLLLTFPR